MRRTTSRAFALIELLVVIAIVGILIQLILPAVQNSREAARRTVCQSNVRQLALAFQAHHSTHGYYPSSGWGWQWTGHPDRGYGKEQPGGWAYNILPHIEQQQVRQLGSGLPDGSVEQQHALFQANSTPIALFNCPSRRQPLAYPVARRAVGAKTTGFSPLLPEYCRIANSVKCELCRADYAANSGAFSPGADSGPMTLDGMENWSWKSESESEAGELDGISYQRSDVRAADVTDGLSHTYCLGEKYIPVANYVDGMSNLDASSLFTGYDADMNRCTGREDQKPRRITPDSVLPRDQHFGAAHPTIFHMAYCDGSVHPVPYDVDPEVHRLLGSRNDGSQVTLSSAAPVN